MLYTSKATGLWTSPGQTTWNEVGTPGNGDTVSIAAGHVVTIPDGSNVTVGTSGATGTTAVTINGSSGSGQGQLILGQTTGATLTLRGDMIYANTSATKTGAFTFTMNPGSTLTFDASQATTPLSQIYVVGPSASNSPNTSTRIIGTQALPCTVTSNASGGNGRFSIRGLGGRTGGMTANWCNFSRIGDSANAWIESSMSSTAGSVDTVSLTDCTLNACGHEQQTSVMTDGVVYAFTRVIRSNSPGSTCMRVSSTTAPTTASTRACTDCSFDITVGNSTNMAGFTFTRCLFFLGIGISAHGTVKYSMVDCMFRKARTSAPGAVDVISTLGGDYTRMFYFADNTVSNVFNCKFWATGGNATSYDTTCNGAHYESTMNNDTTGELYSGTGSPTSLRTITTTNHTVAFAANGTGYDRPGTLWSIATSSANYAFVSNHNTWIASGEPHLSIGETNTSPTDQLAAFKSNITYTPRSPVGTNQYHINNLDQGGSGTPGAAVTSSPAVIDYNCGYPNMKTGTSTYPGYEGDFGGTPGANDINVDPEFLDPTRTLAKWNASRGGTQTTAAAFVTLMADPSLIPAAYAWCQGGWAPTNPLLRNAGHDGVTVGAVEYIAYPRSLTLMGCGI